MKIVKTPLSDDMINELRVGDMLTLSGYIYCGRDAVLPRIVALAEEGRLGEYGIELNGSVIFHTAVSCAGVGPTSSNKLEIESSIIPLSKAGVKLHLGKGQLNRETVEGLDRYNSVYAVIPPVTALLARNTLKSELLAFPELGMEAFYRLAVNDYPIIIAAAHGASIYK